LDRFFFHAAGIDADYSYFNVPSISKTKKFDQEIILGTVAACENYGRKMRHFEDVGW